MIEKELVMKSVKYKRIKEKSETRNRYINSKYIRDIEKNMAVKSVNAEIVKFTWSDVSNGMKGREDGKKAATVVKMAVESSFFVQNGRPITLFEYNSVIKESGRGGIIKETPLMEQKIEERRQNGFNGERNVEINIPPAIIGRALEVMEA